MGRALVERAVGNLPFLLSNSRSIDPWLGDPFGRRPV